MRDWLDGLPAAPRIVVIVAAFVAFACVGLLLTRRFLHLRVGRVPRVILFAVPLIEFFAVLIDLTIAGANEHVMSTRTLEAVEAARITTVYRQAEAFGTDDRCRIQSLIDDYVNFTVDQVWPAQRHGEIVDSHGRLSAIQNAIVSVRSDGPAVAGAQDAIFGQFGDYSDLRRQRQAEVPVGLPPTLFYGLLAAGAALIASTWLMDTGAGRHRSGERHSAAVPPAGPQLIVTAIVALFIGVFVAVGLSLDHPFKRRDGLSAKPWRQALEMASDSPVGDRVPGCPLTIAQYVGAAGVRPGA